MATWFNNEDWKFRPHTSMIFFSNSKQLLKFFSKTDQLNVVTYNNTAFHLVIFFAPFLLIYYESARLILKYGLVNETFVPQHGTEMSTSCLTLQDCLTH